ncbi:hypothetical protein [Sorangium sp. So ce1153]|uniref:hypothetical protein n=1 Tax=Sorangium sp. So ce1153 TaxID=3133333 RepID=UPI003F5F09F3
MGKDDRGGRSSTRGARGASGAPGAAAQLAADRLPAVARFWPARCAPGCAALVRCAPLRPARPPAARGFVAPARCGAARFAPAALRAVFRPAAAVDPVVLRPPPAAPPAAVRFLVAAAFFAAALRCRLVCPAAAFLAVLPAFFALAVVLRAVPGRVAAPAPALRAPFLA